ncbi:hypothetical protein evm_003267 [Chilo suppressalis]|nr:hypothetical protein evm_003267 [Chilo suppressalis]
MAAKRLILMSLYSRHSCVHASPALPHARSYDVYDTMYTQPTRYTEGRGRSLASHQWYVRVHVLVRAAMEHFIEKVKLCPSLWDTGHLHYRDIVKKDSAWERIAKECGIENGREAKAVWKKLRDSHREAMRRRKTCTIQAAQNFKPWRYETEMEFLLPQVESRASYLNVSNDSQIGTPTSLSASETSTNNNDMRSPASPTETLGTLLIPRSTESDRRNQNKLDTEDSITISQRERRREQKQSERDQWRRNILDTERCQRDALSNLFTSLYQKTRELPTYLQLRVQREMFEAVTRAEEEALSLDFSPASSSTSTYRNICIENNQISILPDTSPVNKMYLSPTYSSSPLSDVATE